MKRDGRTEGFVAKFESSSTSVGTYGRYGESGSPHEELIGSNPMGGAGAFAIPCPHGFWLRGSSSCRPAGSVRIAGGQTLLPLQFFEMLPAPHGNSKRPLPTYHGGTYCGTRR